MDKRLCLPYKIPFGLGKLKRDGKVYTQITDSKQATDKPKIVAKNKILASLLVMIITA
ncbi:MAG: hypothetical protein SOW25_02480 [Helicobacter sp.]|nr:hypothetical protein [Helicobacter sp.]